MAAIWIVAIMAEGAAIYFLMPLIRGDGTLFWEAGVALTCHLAAAVILSLGGHYGLRALPDKRFRMQLYAVLVLFIPALGVVGGVSLQLLCDRWIRARGLVEEFQAETEHQVIETEQPEARIDLDSFLEEELTVQPVLDILAGHDDNLKRGAIDTLRRIGTPEAVHVLKKCLSSDSPEVRYNAHTALTRLDEFHAQQIKAAQQELETHPGHADAHLKHAKRCVAYGESGLLDDDTRRHYTQMARMGFVHAAEKGTADTWLILELGRLEMMVGSYDDALSRFEAVLSREPENIPALLGLAELYFASKDAAGLQAIARKLNDITMGEAQSVQEAILINFWTSAQMAGS
jgi:thioredoxin-like negative regulator of GroEL